MSYRRAWALLQDSNREFDEPLATTSVGGRVAAAPSSRRFAQRVIAAYRAVERAARSPRSSEFAAARRRSFGAKPGAAATRRASRSRGREVAAQRRGADHEPHALPEREAELAGAPGRHAREQARSADVDLDQQRPGRFGLERGDPAPSRLRLGEALGGLRSRTITSLARTCRRTPRPPRRVRAERDPPRADPDPPGLRCARPRPRPPPRPHRVRASRAAPGRGLRWRRRPAAVTRPCIHHDQVRGQPQDFVELMTDVDDRNRGSDRAVARGKGALPHGARGRCEASGSSSSSSRGCDSSARPIATRCRSPPDRRRGRRDEQRRADPEQLDHLVDADRRGAGPRARRAP